METVVSLAEDTYICDRWICSEFWMIIVLILLYIVDDNAVLSEKLAIIHTLE